MIRLKRIYDEASDDDGHRVLADRLWPRGISKKDARLDDWCREITPSYDLRKWYHADRERRWPEFRKRYRVELAGAGETLDRLAETASEQGLTLLTAAKDRNRNHTVVLKEILEARF